MSNQFQVEVVALTANIQNLETGEVTQTPMPPMVMLSACSDLKGKEPAMLKPAEARECAEALIRAADEIEKPSAYNGIKKSRPLTDQCLRDLQDIVLEGRSLNAVSGLEKALDEIYRMRAAGTYWAAFLVEAACAWRDDAKRNPYHDGEPLHVDSRMPCCSLAVMVDNYRAAKERP